MGFACIVSSDALHVVRGGISALQSLVQAYFLKSGEVGTSHSMYLRMRPTSRAAFDGRGKFLVEPGCVPVDLGESQNLFRQFRKRTVRVFMRNKQQGPGHAQTRIGPVIRNAPARIEQTLAFQVHKCPAERRVVAAVTTEHISSVPRISAAWVLRAGLDSILAWGCFCDFCPSAAVHRRRGAVSGPGPRSLVPRTYGTSRSNSNASCPSLTRTGAATSSSAMRRSISPITCFENGPRCRYSAISITM
jgi:hypothetical protein